MVVEPPQEKGSGFNSGLNILTISGRKMKSHVLPEDHYIYWKLLDGIILRTARETYLKLGNLPFITVILGLKLISDEQYFLLKKEKIG